jgi:acyl-CoA synthetase (AMP-forming)/AMP-acid ligase II
VSALFERLQADGGDVDAPFLVAADGALALRHLREAEVDLQGVRPGDVVALVGDFDAVSVATLLQLIERRAIVVPLTAATRSDHEYFLEVAQVDWVSEGGSLRRRVHGASHALIEALRERGHAGLVLFSTGTTGRPKGILHDLSLFLKRFETPRPTQRTINFLMFDHIGGINTLLHTLFNRGVVIVPRARTVDAVLEAARVHEAEVLPTTPTFLRMMLMSGAIPAAVPPSLKLITYGTERMDQGTLDELCALLPGVDFRQTFGMSELGIVRVKSRARDSLFMKVGGEGIETRVVAGVLQIRSENRMLGYLNAESPFDDQGWYDTKDIVESDGEWIRVVGRTSEVINVGGLKFMASEVERVALAYPGVALADVRGRTNPVTGQHVELLVETTAGGALDIPAFQAYLRERLAAHMVPRRVQVGAVSVGHRFKKL